MNLTLKSTLAALTLGAMSTFSSQAAVNITGDPALGTGVLEITEDIIFNVTVSGSFLSVVFDEYVTSDGNFTAVLLSPSVIGYSLNGISGTTSAATFVDNNEQISGDISANDALFYASDGFDQATAIQLAANDEFIIKAGTWSIAADADLNPAIVKNFNGQVFITNSLGERISDVTYVPEPSSAILASLGGLALLARRKR